MKKILWLSFITVLAISACKKDEYVFDQSPDQRVNAAMSNYSDQITGAQYGWKGYLTTGLGNKFNYFFKFNDSNEVRMVCDFDSASGAIVNTASYRIKALQQPSLIFDTYSYVHLPADPNGLINGGETGTGLYSDFEFYFDSVKTDTIIMRGTIRGSRLVLVRATQNEMDEYFTGGLSKGFFFHRISAFNSQMWRGAKSSLGIGGRIFSYWKRFSIGSNTYEIDEGSFDPFSRNIAFSWYSGGVKNTFRTHYTFGLNKVILDTAFNAGGTVVNEFTDLVWNDASNSLTVNINGGTSTTTFAGAKAPMGYDTTAFTAFRNKSIADDTYWIGGYMFMRNGVYNNYGVDTVTATTTAGRYTYYYSLYWAGYGTGNPQYDLMAPIFLNPAQSGLALLYGFAGVTNNSAFPIVTNGIANFNYGGILGSGNPTTGGWAQTLSLFRASTGYYFIKLPNGDYDQVSVSDGQSWINWIW